MATPEELAYCAGVIDSDGCIRVGRGIKRDNRAGKHSAYADYHAAVHVGQVEPQAVDLLKRVFGGSIYLRKRDKKAHRTLMVWRVRDNLAAECARQLLPYLRIKQAQALNCIALQDYKHEYGKRSRAVKGKAGTTFRPADVMQRLEELYAESRRLNAGSKEEP